MFRLSTAIFLLALVCASQSASVPAGNKLHFLGKATTVSRKINGEPGIYSTSYYFLSQNAAAWATAGSDCKAFLGDTATLVSIETYEELQEIQALLQSSDDTGSTYWTAGKYDGRKFAWEDGSDVDAITAWDEGHPNTRTPVTRVFTYTVGGLALRTDFQTVSLRYICELVA